MFLCQPASSKIALNVEPAASPELNSVMSSAASASSSSVDVDVICCECEYQQRFAF